jgi:fluoroacetyl-CoA thioesterase
MNKQLMVGITGHREINVTAAMSAIAFGSGTVDVFATPAMIALMEQTAMESVSSCLPDGCVTVGTEVHINHLRATAIGKKVSCHSILGSVNDRQLTFEVSASDEAGLIGKGTHTRYVVDKLRFMNKL